MMLLFLVSATYFNLREPEQEGKKVGKKKI
jgi:hypothetical protein